MEIQIDMASTSEKVDIERTKTASSSVLAVIYALDGLSLNGAGA